MKKKLQYSEFFGKTQAAREAAAKCGRNVTEVEFKSFDAPTYEQQIQDLIRRVEILEKNAHVHK